MKSEVGKIAEYPKDAKLPDNKRRWLRKAVQKWLISHFMVMMIWKQAPDSPSLENGEGSERWQW